METVKSFKKKVQLPIWILIKLIWGGSSRSFKSFPSVLEDNWAENCCPGGWWGHKKEIVMGKKAAH